MSDIYEKFLEYLDRSEKVAFFGGAGVSTESGIPDFRSKDGLYNQHDVQFDRYTPEYLLSHTCLIRDPEVYYEFHRQKLDTADIKPNRAHIYLAKLEEQGKLTGIVTQNIDGLHQRAGSKKVYEIHGSAQRNYCMKCGKKYPADYIFKSKEAIPRCDCSGQIRPDITLYEEPLPVDATRNAIDCISSADMLIIGGTSLTVYPAASYIDYFRGKYLVIINRDALHVRAGNRAEVLTVTEKIGEFFSKVAELQNISLED
ncbi:MAG: NAD-dependent protein deacylase [Lachnospiraceae bacterium]|nr:NAD-dependent protein deacylase [Lachnospiraceae bacterium]